jgi:rSAM/selenodomain-associated transferase 1
LNGERAAGTRTGLADALIVFVRDPVPGAVKTRLASELTPRDAAELYRAMAEDVVGELAAGERYDTIVFFSPPDARRRIETWLGVDLALEPQRGGDVGARMASALAWAFDAGYERAIIVGSDCPLVEAADVESAFEELRSCDVVLGPSEDGGYYLIGASSVPEGIFEGMPWGEERVLAETVRRLERSGLAYRLVTRRFDVDRVHDVRRLLRACGDGSSRVFPRRTMQVLVGMYGE